MFSRFRRIDLQTDQQTTATKKRDYGGTVIRPPVLIGLTKILRLASGLQIDPQPASASARKAELPISAATSAHCQNATFELNANDEPP